MYVPRSVHEDLDQRKRNDFEFEVFHGLRFVTNVPTAFDSWLVELGNVSCE